MMIILSTYNDAREGVCDYYDPRGYQSYVSKSFKVLLIIHQGFMWMKPIQLPMDPHDHPPIYLHTIFIGIQPKLLQWSLEPVAVALFHKTNTLVRKRCLKPVIHLLSSLF